MGPDWVFHRAFDVVPDPFAALETLVQLGFRRILTSGQRPTAEEGVDLIEKLIELADGRIEILPGSGVKASNVSRLRERLKSGQIHAPAFSTESDLSTQAAAISFNGRDVLESGFRAVSSDAVTDLAQSTASGP